MQFKSRQYEIAQAQASSGIELTPSNLGFNPSHEFIKAQICTNDFGGGSGTFEIEFAPAGSDLYFPYPTSYALVGGQDVVIIGGGDFDPLFESLKITFAGATEDIVLNVAFIDPKS